MARLGPRWEHWIAENLVLGVPEPTLARTLAGEGFTAAEIERALAAARGNHHVLLARRWQRRHAKLAWTMRAIQRTAALAPPAVERLARPLPEEFLVRCYAPGRPAVLTGIIDDWPALRAWTPAYLKERLGHHDVEIQGDRARDPLYERNSIAHKQVVRFSDLVDRVVAGPSNDVYMTANNAGRNAAFLRDAFADVTMPPYFTASWEGRGFFWFGPEGTVTPLHHDLTNNAMAQVMGRKRVRLISPLDTPRLYNHRHCFSEVDLEAPDLARFPLFAGVQVLDVELAPGEVLFLPVGWWHHVRALDASITISLTNFTADNTYSDGYADLYGDL
ncbi:MAG TPA: cupin-like domain-containing protein [Kofleriaceae bacterium]|nr:cupin-like domain-containing protein [Kofleriaceae bacterium]